MTLPVPSALTPVTSDNDVIVSGAIVSVSALEAASRGSFGSVRSSSPFSCKKNLYAVIMLLSSSGPLLSTTFRTM